VDLPYNLADWIYGLVRSGPPFPRDLLWIVLAGIPVTLIHELGHAYAARRLLGTEVEVSVGNAGRLAEVRLAGITATIKALPHPGRAAGYASFDASRARASDVVWIALAGPLASLAGLVVSAGLFSVGPAAGVLHDLLWGIVFTSVGGVLTVIPFVFQERRDGPRLRTDGRLALDALKVIREVR
jgi:hypothetical protein